MLLAINWLDLSKDFETSQLLIKVYIIGQLTTEQEIE